MINLLNRSSIVSLKIIFTVKLLGCWQSKSKERQWLRHQTHGDVDEGKLIEGVIGEKGVYKRRGEKEPEVCYCYTIFHIISFIAPEL